jgi:hypothetical protein
LKRPLVFACLAVAIATAAWCALAIGARATYGARTSADEPQYLLSALSLAEDGDLDIADELREERWRAFHAAPLPEQTKPLADGRRVSPHDPLLPVVLAVPMELGGWAAAKATLAALAGALAAALVWVAHRRFDVPLAVAVPVVLAFSLSAPLAAYGTQVYPELPAALAVTLAIAALTGPLRARGLLALAAAVVTLPWLSVKYAPVAVVLVGIALVRLWRRGEQRTAVALAGGLLLAGATFLLAHQVIYGGFTPYAAGDHFVGGELTVAGNDPDYVGRSRRLLGLLVDRNFGLVAWAPVFLLAIPAVVALARVQVANRATLLAPLAAGWLTASFVALTMHGWWWPGRQVVVVLPAIVLAVCWWAARVRWARTAVIALGVLGAFTWAWLVAEVLRLDLRLIIDFTETSAPLHRAVRPLLPDLARPGVGDWARYGGWLVAAVALGVLGLRTATTRTPSPNQENFDDHPISVGDRHLGDLAAAVPRGRLW